MCYNSICYILLGYDERLIFERWTSKMPFLAFYFSTFAPVAQLDRALACGAKGRTFESYRVYHILQLQRLLCCKSILRDVFCCPAPLLRFIWGRKYDSIRDGSVAEWLKAHDSKSCGQQCLGGSNPLASAIF